MKNYIWVYGIVLLALISAHSNNPWFWCPALLFCGANATLIANELNSVLE